MIHNELKSQKAVITFSVYIYPVYFR